MEYSKASRLCKVACLTLFGVSSYEGFARETAQITNPIGRLARTFSSQLVQTEDRVGWLDERLSSLAKFNEHAMSMGLGFRGYRANRGDPDPQVTLDLGKSLDVSTLYLFPAQREFLEDPGTFPKRFTLESANREDFSDSKVIFHTGGSEYTAKSIYPIPFAANVSARFVRLTVHEGHQKGMLDHFGLSELVVISNQDPVSFDAVVTSNCSLNVENRWFPAALIDGQTPLGIWQNGINPSTSIGEIVPVADPTDTVIWTVKFPKSHLLDRVVLFPYQLELTSDSLILPNELKIELLSPDGNAVPYFWKNARPGSDKMTPLVISTKGTSATEIRLTALSPYIMGDNKISALSEMQAMSGGENVAAGLPVSRNHGGNITSVDTLTDGFTSAKKIIPVWSWLEQLHERQRVERELATLRPIHRQQSSESELNATWGSAIVLGLTFLIPVFIVERRRLISHEQIDSLRKRIASDLHDDIGSNLGSISLIARTARKDLVRLQGPEEVAHDLGEVESIARESSLAMRDIVWLLERRQDSIGDLVQRMRETAGRLLREINYTVECESSKTTAKLSLDAKRHLFLFYKEAIHNVLKHSGAQDVTIRLWDENDKLALEIIDNGVGLPTNEESAPTSVRKLEDRARVLDGLLNIVSSKETGTRIQLYVKRSHLTAYPSLA